MKKWQVAAVKEHKQSIEVVKLAIKFSYKNQNIILSTMWLSITF